MSEYYKTREQVSSSKKTKSRMPVGMRRTRRFQPGNTRVKLCKTGILRFFQRSGSGASLINLSKNGLQVLIAESLKPDDNYRITLYVPGFMNPLDLKARVVWCRPYKYFRHKNY